ncbi:MAG: 3-methyladenine DNA glycosylase [Chloroflexi bacterium HGW-Chloroflexi-3]|nr:MAG: 3-methyladenine DNA glycosylase [Chloroflexi bacterium HGW-Chloroflexi-3]
MMIDEILPERFYDRYVVDVARDLLGKRLVRILDGQRLSGIITESEAYDGVQDLACHARVGKTNRNAVMFGPAGRAYVYFTYGMHWCLNVVTGEQDYPAAVLVRSIEPLEGLTIISEARKRVNQKNWTNGPAKLTQALQINGGQNGINITRRTQNLWIETGWQVEESLIQSGPRIGIANTPEPWRSIRWRFWFDVTQSKQTGNDS